MRDIFNRKRPAALTTPAAPLPAQSAPDPWRPINPRDGTPRLILSWVTTEAGSGFAVDTFCIATRQIAEFYLDGGAAVASLVRQPEGGQIDTGTQGILEPTARQSAAARAGESTARPRALITPGATPAEE